MIQYDQQLHIIILYSPTAGTEVLFDCGFGRENAMTRADLTASIRAIITAHSMSKLITYTDYSVVNCYISWSWLFYLQSAAFDQTLLKELG